MRKEEISKRFDTPSQIKYNALRLENDILSRQIAKNQKAMHDLLPLVEKEQDSAANKLDKDFPKWREVLSDAYLQAQNKKIR